MYVPDGRTQIMIDVENRYIDRRYKWLNSRCINNLFLSCTVQEF